MFIDIVIVIIIVVDIVNDVNDSSSISSLSSSLSVTPTVIIVIVTVLCHHHSLPSSSSSLWCATLADNFCDIYISNKSPSSSSEMKMLRGTWPRMGSSSWQPSTSLSRRWTRLSTRRWRTPSAPCASTRSPGWSTTLTEAISSTMPLPQKLRWYLFRFVATVCVRLLEISRWTS